MVSKFVMADPALFRRLGLNTPVKPMPATPSVHLAAARPKMAGRPAAPPPPPPPGGGLSSTVPPPPPGDEETAAPVSIQEASTSVLESANKLIKKLQKHLEKSKSDHSTMKQDMKDLKQKVAKLEKEAEEKEQQHSEDVKVALKKQGDAMNRRLGVLLGKFEEDVNEVMRQQLDYKL